MNRKIMKKIIRAGVAFVLLLTMIFCENQVSSKAASNKKLKTPKVKTSSTAENITLEWTTVKGAKGYTIQRNDGTGYKTIGKTKDTSFSDDDVYSDIRYNYRVRAYGKKSGKKVYSAWKKVSSETLGSDIKKISPERFDTYVNEIYDRIDEIRSSFTDIRKDANYIPGETYMGTAYYLSADGDDANDGKSILTPWKTLERLAEAEIYELEYGDAVFFRRGDTFRGSVNCVSGVTYASYGNGTKPVITGSPENGADPMKWTIYGKTEDGGLIWELYKDITDCGNMYFDDNTPAEHKIYPERKNGSFMTGTRRFDPLKDLKNDLDFVSFADSKLPYDMNGYVDVSDGNTEYSVGKLYLRCDSGNPGDVFKKRVNHFSRGILLWAPTCRRQP